MFHRRPSSARSWGALAVAIMVAASGLFAGGRWAHAQTEAPTNLQEPKMPTRAKGGFDVELSPLSLHHEGADPLLGRMSIDKQFHGDLEATSTGEMLSARTAVEGSAGYVAIERVEGTLQGRAGSFVLQHSSTMDRGTPHQQIEVVPGSGTGDLAGLRGTMVIENNGGVHGYVFDYTLSDMRTVEDP